MINEVRNNIGYSNEIDKAPNRRFLDHTRGPDAPLDGKNITLRAKVDADGYCIEYRESLRQHFMRIGNFLNNKPMPISGFQMGKDRALAIYGLGA